MLALEQMAAVAAETAVRLAIAVNETAPTSKLGGGGGGQRGKMDGSCIGNGSYRIDGPVGRLAGNAENHGSSSLSAEEL